MNCEQIYELLSARLDGALSAEDEARVQAHLDACPDCRRLYEAMEPRLREAGFVNLYACIADPVREDEYLTHASERFHAKMGYQTVARFEACGYKFGRWYSMIWMGKRLKETLPDPQPFIPFGGQF